jgi:hypothetical protein
MTCQRAPSTFARPMSFPMDEHCVVFFPK